MISILAAGYLTYKVLNQYIASEREKGGSKESDAKDRKSRHRSSVSSSDDTISIESIHQEDNFISLSGDKPKKPDRNHKLLIKTERKSDQMESKTELSRSKVIGTSSNIIVHLFGRVKDTLKHHMFPLILCGFLTVYYLSDIKHMDIRKENLFNRNAAKLETFQNNFQNSVICHNKDLVDMGNIRKKKIYFPLLLLSGLDFLKDIKENSGHYSNKSIIIHQIYISNDSRNSVEVMRPSNENSKHIISHRSDRCDKECNTCLSPANSRQTWCGFADIIPKMFETMIQKERKQIIKIVMIPLILSYSVVLTQMSILIFKLI